MERAMCSSSANVLSSSEGGGGIFEITEARMSRKSLFERVLQALCEPHKLKKFAVVFLLLALAMAFFFVRKRQLLRRVLNAALRLCSNMVLRPRAKAPALTMS